MKRTMIILTLLVITNFVIGQPVQLPPMEIVDPNVAIFAATTYVPTFYPGNWCFYDRVECYKIDGSVSAHIIIFKNMDKAVDTPRMLANSLSKSFKEVQEYEAKLPTDYPPEDAQKMNQMTLEITQTINQMKRERYHTKEYTTVIMGATTYSHVIIRWYPGLPEFMVKRDQIKAWLKETCDDDFTFRKLIYMGPKEIRYEVVSSKGEIYLVDFSKKELSIKTLEQVKKDGSLIQQPLSIPNDLPEAQKQVIEEGIKIQKLRNIQLWQNYKTLYERTKVEE
jgi:hypothetical protein